MGNTGEISDIQREIRSWHIILEENLKRRNHVRKFDADVTMTLTGLCSFKGMVELHRQLRDFRLPSRSRGEVRSSGLLRSK
jgi:hypothetical protein